MEMYGSLQNRLSERCKSPKPEIGMGATELMYSDRNAYEVVEIIDDMHIVVRRMKAELVGSYYDQDYKLSSDPSGRTQRLFLTKKGQWREQWGRQLGNVFALGYASEYRDPSF